MTDVVDKRFADSRRISIQSSGGRKGLSFTGG